MTQDGYDWPNGVQDERWPREREVKRNPSAAEVLAALHRGQVVSIETWVGGGGAAGAVLSLGLDGLPSVDVRILTREVSWTGEHARERLTIQLADWGMSVAPAQQLSADVHGSSLTSTSR